MLFYTDIKELEARFIHLESLRKEAVHEFEEIFFYEMEGKLDTITSLFLNSDPENRIHAESLQEAHSSLLNAYWAYGRSVKELIEVFLFMRRTDYKFFHGEWYKAACELEKVEDEMDKVFNLILSFYKKELRKELRELKLKMALCNLTHGDILRTLERRLRRVEDELEHPTLTREKLLANK